MMKLTIKIETKSKSKLIKELERFIQDIKNELEDSLCKSCTASKEGCTVGGGSSEPKLESDWKLKRK